MIQRKYIPGDQWLYYKIYTGPKTADNILANTARQFIENTRDEGLYERFFFIRYSDPGFHIRLRFKASGDEATGAIITRLQKALQPLVEANMVSKVVIDTYSREVERYGPVNMERAESIFNIDSYYILELLSVIKSDENLRWQLSLQLIDHTLDAFGMDLQSKINFISKIAENFKREFGYTSNTFSKHLNDKFRSLREIITSSLDKQSADNPEIARLLSARRESIRDVVKTMETTAEDDFISSITHMTMNRWFRSKNRVYEMVIYNFLLRYYESCKARQKKQEAPA